MSSKKINLKLLKEKYAVCQLGETEKMPEWLENNEFSSVTRTKEELSIVTVQENVPKEIISEKDWKIFQIEGKLDFSLIGILAKLSSIFAEKSISIFVISTFDTDYILVKEKDLESSIKALLEQGYGII